MLNTLTSACPLCPAPSDSNTKDFGRALLFKCESGHEFILRVDIANAVAALPQSGRDMLAAQASARTDGLIALIENSAGTPRVALVPRSNWLK